MHNIYNKEMPDAISVSVNPSSKPYFGSSPAIEKVKNLVNIAAAAECAVLLLGNSGTGKGVIARWIHEHGSRKRGEFVGINSTGLGGSLLKSELFGHMKGSFTDASYNHDGLINAANGGTLFLDEIGEMDIGVQARLLNAIEEKTYRRIGSNQTRRSDFRLICATNRDLRTAIDDGTFREDFYFRINTLQIVMPPLGERAEDIPGLTEHLLKSLGYDRFPLDGDIVKELRRHTWRGNIRELRNTLERALVFAHGEVLTLDHFSNVFDGIRPPTHGVRGVRSSKPRDALWNLENLEFEHITRTLKHFRGDKQKTAAALGIASSSLYRKLDLIQKGGLNNTVVHNADTAL